MTEIPTKCEDWSLNEETEEESENKGKRFWWNKTYSLSVWEAQVKLDLSKKSIAMQTDFDVWRGFIRFQIDTVYKLCAICNGPEDCTDMRVCCYCGHTVHMECSGPADKEQIAWKPANRGFEKHLAVCLACDDKLPEDGKKRPIVEHRDDARRCAMRTLNLADEIGKELTARCHVILNYPDLDERDRMAEVQNVNRAFFQPGDSAKWLVRKPVPNKCGGLGVHAVVDIPRFSIVGVYPGYEDPLSGEHAKVERPGPKYSLVDLNCADYFNRVFLEYDTCFTPFINEPNEQELSNVAWIQETCHLKGRLSVMTVRDIKAGEELLIGYGPLYPRTYPYNYDAFAFHGVDGYDDPPCFALWHWKTKDEKDAEFVCYAEYQSAENRYSYWETEEEAAERRKNEKAAAGGDDDATAAAEKKPMAVGPPPQPPQNADAAAKK